jgi:DNA-binding response OmpR family regulator
MKQRRHDAERAGAGGPAITAVEAAYAGKHSARPLRVLALEDDGDTCEVLALLLSHEEGFDLHTCGDVATCLEQLRAAERAGRPYHVLMLDLLLRDGQSGAEVIRTAETTHCPELPPVVVCTALSDNLLQRDRPVLDACGASIISKPFDADALIDELRLAARRPHHAAPR